MYNKTSNRFLQGNAGFVPSFLQVMSPLLDETGSISRANHSAFFGTASPEQIARFFSALQRFVVTMVSHIHERESGRNQWSRYFLDLVVLVASNLNLGVRAMAIDNARSTVDIRGASIDTIVGDLRMLYDMFRSHHMKVVILPADFCLLYNVADYIVLRFDVATREFDLPHFFEMKAPRTLAAAQDLEQLERESRQVDRMRQLVEQYNLQASRDNLFGSEMYLQSLLRGVDSLVPGTPVRVDDLTTLLVTDAAHGVADNPHHWTVDMIEEIACGNILPSVFRGLSLRWWDKLMERGLHIWIDVDREHFRKTVTSLDAVERCDKHQNPYQAYLHVKGGGRVSIASILHLKYSQDVLLTVLAKHFAEARPHALRYGSTDVARNLM